MKKAPPYPAIDVTIGGTRLRMKRDEVIQKLKGTTPGRIKTHVVEIESVLYPVKDAFATVTGMDPLDFNTITARTAFKRLGFKTFRVVP
jgi:hypothetical protein